MVIAHVAMYVNDLEKAKDFFMTGTCVQIVNSALNWNSKVYFDIPMRRQQMHKRKLGKR